MKTENSKRSFDDISKEELFEELEHRGKIIADLKKKVKTTTAAASEAAAEKTPTLQNSRLKLRS